MMLRSGILILLVVSSKAAYSCMSPAHKLKADQTKVCDFWNGCQEGDCCELDTSYTPTMANCSASTQTCEAHQKKGEHQVDSSMLDTGCCVDKEGLCSVFACPDGFSVPPSKENIVGNDKETCCTEDSVLCSTITCGAVVVEGSQTPHEGKSVDIFETDPDKANMKVNPGKSADDNQGACCKPKSTFCYGNMATITCDEGTSMDYAKEASTKEACCVVGPTCATFTPISASTKSTADGAYDVKATQTTVVLSAALIALAWQSLA